MRAGAGRCTGDANIRSPLQNVLCPPHPLPPLLTSDAVIILIADCHHGDHGHRVFSYHLTANQMSIWSHFNSAVRCALCWQPVVARLGAGRVCDVFGIKLGFCWLVVCSLNVRQSRYFDKVGRTGQCGHGHVGTEQGMGGMEGILALRRLIDQTYCFITIAIAMAVLCKNVWRLRWSVWK